jgi:hypothetical protein
MRYGSLPKPLGPYAVDNPEMMLYQYLPIKFADQRYVKYEKRLKCFDQLIDHICCDFAMTFGQKAFDESYIYITAKHMYVSPHQSFNRHGWHSDGFGTDDINYIWSDKFATVFNQSHFQLSKDEQHSMLQMAQQARESNIVIYDNGMLLRLDQFNIHRVARNEYGAFRTFLKVSFSKDRYDLQGNSHNDLLDYHWLMKPRQVQRNVPQTTITR